MEVVSPSTVTVDYRAKHSEYAVLDIPEYWILDSIAAEQVDPDLTEPQKRELDRRIDDYEANPDEVMTWAEVKVSIKARA